jgi:OOP family OmpA-OmpF porin
MSTPYTPQLLAPTEKAKTVDGYMIEMKGFASVTGSAAMNQRLSEHRARNVTNILLQQGRVPLTRIYLYQGLARIMQKFLAGSNSQRCSSQK